MQIIAQLHPNAKGKHRSYSRAYESPKNSYVYQGSRKGSNNKNISTGNGAANGRRINQTIEVGSTIEHLELDMSLASPNDLTTI